MNKHHISYTKAVSNEGNPADIMRLMSELNAGENADKVFRIAFLGGSITQGCLASEPDKCYASLVYDWFVKTFPKASFEYVNAGIGATDSQFGCARVADDALSYEPDFMIVEYSVNDEANDHYLETYEGLVRKILSAKKRPALLIVHNVRYDDGASAQAVHARVARHYGIPAVSMRETILPEIMSGRIDNRDITPDDLHPNDEGHRLVASVITHYLESISKSLKPWREGTRSEKPEDETIPAPMTANGYEDSVRYRNNTIKPMTEGFTADSEPQNGITDIFKKGWYSSEKGAKISFIVNGSNIALQYRRTINKPAPVANVYVDGDKANSIRLDANFDEDWGDKLCLADILSGGAAGDHTVELEIADVPDDCKTPFYLVSIIVSGGSR